MANFAGGFPPIYEKPPGGGRVFAPVGARDNLIFSTVFHFVGNGVCLIGAALVCCDNKAGSVSLTKR